MSGTCVLRPLTTADMAAAMRLVEKAGWNQTPADWARFLSSGEHAVIAAVIDDAVIGTAATIAYGDRLAWIGMVIVAEAWRGQGIGGQLLKGACDLLDRRKVVCIKLDATPAGEPLYARHGFVRERALERWELNGPAAVTNRGEVEPVSDAAVALDSDLFGADRQALAASLKRDWPEAAIEVREAGQVRGYALGRRGIRADQMGPWMARDERAATRLLDTFLDRSARGRVFIDCVVDHPFARRLLETRGFQVQRPLLRMSRGERPSADDRDLLAILGPEFG